MNKQSDNLLREFSFLILLICLFAAVLVPPYFEGMALLDTVWRLVFSLVMLVSLATLAGSRGTLVFAGIMLIPAIVTNWIPLFNDAVWTIYADNLTSILYFSIIGYHLGRFVFTAGRVTSNVLYAAMCLYLILALVWAAIYNNLYIFYDDAFAFNSPQVLALANNPESTMGLFTYFSFVTLSTLGYGDIVPLTRVTQSWAAVEAMIGQFYIAIVMARLVSLHVVDNGKSTGPRSGDDS